MNLDTQTILTIVVPIVVALITGGLSLVGVIYTVKSQFNKQQQKHETAQQLVNKEFEDYKTFLHQVNKDLKEDIQTLSARVDEHNSYGRKIPAIEKDIENIKSRLDRLEDK